MSMLYELLKILTAFYAGFFLGVCWFAMNDD
nr:MAG TPA: hypothetical protein [Caudoviricetes sp.]DAV02532.1 MAG TPA: hypothetical protein [Caudoviricetes sp.]